ncbi:MAG: alpha/beta hydrolase [Actinobacteria bacterium]|nr:MAG: alpha/beta hydrolase [Actinomycetota bacterium]
MVRELRSALAAVSATPPFVLVGHSFASLTVRAFARQHPAEIAAIVLVDGAHEDQMARFPRELDPAPLLAGVAAQLRELAERAEGGEPIPPLVAPPASFPPELAAAYSDATLPTAVRLRTAASEYESLGESQAELRALGSPPWGFPLVALRHGIPQPMPGVAADVNERYEAVWRELQEELAARSTSGTVVAVDGAGHSIHHDRPDAVVEAIAGVLGRPIAGTSG